MKKGLLEVLMYIMIIIQSSTNNLPEATLIKQKVSYNNPIVEIPKIYLKREFYPFDKEKNNVDKNIEVVQGSHMPNEKSSNLILAAHSGSTDIAYFKNLDRLNINDIVYIYYKDRKYKYIIFNIYDVEKTGYVGIKRDKTKTTLTLITCKKNTNKQTIFIGYLALATKAL